MRFSSLRLFRSLYRWASPVIDPFRIVSSVLALIRYPAFLLDYIRYCLITDEQVPIADIFPCLADKSSSSQSGRGHYFYQDIWALARIIERIPAKQVDIGSRIDGFAGQLSAVCDVEYVDIRGVDLGLDRFTMLNGSILCLPYPDRSVDSLSCLHVIEHVGLGRYGDPVNPDGSEAAASELCRVLALHGRLLLGIPIGRERVAFNAHRIFSPFTVLNWFAELRLVEFSVVNDAGIFRRFAHPHDYTSADYACGLFMFERDQ